MSDNHKNTWMLVLQVFEPSYLNDCVYMEHQSAYTPNSRDSSPFSIARSFSLQLDSFLPRYVFSNSKTTL